MKLLRVHLQLFSTAGKVWRRTNGAGGKHAEAGVGSPWEIKQNYVWLCLYDMDVLLVLNNKLKDTSIAILHTV